MSTVHTYSEAALKVQFPKIMQNSIIIKVTCISNFNESTKAYLLNETSKYLLVSNSKYVSNLIWSTKMRTNMMDLPYE